MKQNQLLFLAIGVAVGYLLANQNKNILPQSSTDSQPMIGRYKYDRNVLIAL